MKRMWINQPSPLDSLHSLHGVNVLADTEGDDRVYFLTGPVISQVVPERVLSEGWKLPVEIDEPRVLVPDLVELRDAALDLGDMRSAVLLSHTIAWMKSIKGGE